MFDKKRFQPSVFFILSLIILLFLTAPLAADKGPLDDFSRAVSPSVEEAPAVDCSVPGDYSTIQAAVADTNCETIRVGSGVFAENVTIDRHVTIIGQGAASTEVNGGAIGSVFMVEPDGKVTLQGLLITNGLAKSGDVGGGIHNRGDLTLDESTVRSNGRGGLANWDGGTATITNSTIRDNTDAGGIGNRGDLFITGSTISGNSGGLRGGGIWSFGRLIIENSTIIGNDCTGEGGGIYNEFGTVELSNSTISSNSAKFGGAISLFGGTAAIENSTISGNSASRGGGIHNLGTITITSSTINGNSADDSSGGIANGGSLDLRNSMVVKNQNGADCGGSKAIASLGYNLDSDNTCNLTATGDLPNRDPLLGLLQDNGGVTFTHALLGGSPAIDAGSCSGAVADQRGFARPADMPDVPNVADSCDIGAFELQPVSIDFSVFLPTVMGKK